MSVFPANIPPETVPLARIDDRGEATISHNWWLFLYNVWQSSGGTTSVVFESADNILANQIFGS